MIRVTFNLNSDHLITAFQMTGHADAGPYGQDIVCAAVSALSISTINGLEQVAKTKPNIDSDDDNGGFFDVTDISLVHDAQVIMQTFFNGMNDIAESYPQNIEIKMFKN
ncbi:ribosomal-processing cysteine protease Prp [Limosilactobacillus sp. c9Ua_26_M]|uniref:Ribosomal processing cysteine protease Prp n=1 Tax=Limosilactobacillus urinaemulieris TaxID=2742600 RepID=A0ABR8ZHW2_9LACO|nr:ribosomal-processing cysteine protease Prp [Limosilactobacillus urinaemulieris]MBD8084875.1 ribosomal-processing cysteine protease Prp [Limosilactobacillus urinaemulieris]